MKKTKLTRSMLAACSIVALSAVMYGCVHNGDDSTQTGTEMPEPMEGMPVDVTMDVALGATEHARLKVLLPESGSSDTLTIPAGGTATRGATADHYGVVFSCMSAYPCTVTVTNSLGTILASVTTQMLPDADDPVVTAGTIDPVDAFARLNDGNTESIRNLLDDQAGTTTAPDLDPTELVGMGIGGPGVLNADDAGLRGSFDPNTANAGGTATGPGAVPGLTMGSMITGADHGFDASMSDIASAPDGWVMKTLFADWGDTAVDTGDGGFETGAIVVKNLGPGTPHPFDRKLSGNYVNVAAQNMFALTLRADGSAPGVTTLATSVDINSADGVDNTATARQWSEMVFDSNSLVGAQSQDPNIDENETFRGSYFGAPGQFQCIEADNADLGCGIARNADGVVMVVDGDAAMGIQGGGRWTFTPDPGAMIEVPDQDWMAYGAWLTTPDDAPGEHRMGVFFNGMDPWAPATNALTATDPAGLRGSATYSGGATGIYVDGLDSGLFTARAMLTADFDADMDGVDDDTEYMISGRIDNFRGTDGVFLGDDTQRSPNDPTAGENDWVVLLNAFDFGDTQDGEIDATATAGSADGVSWAGSWNGQLFGPSSNADGALAPSGVAGRFWAETADADSVADGDGMPATAVVGAFGADQD